MNRRHAPIARPALGLVLCCALGSATGCATSQPATTTTTTTPAPAAEPSPASQIGQITSDVKRIEELQELDHKNQIQAQQVKTLEKTVADLEEKLSAALKRGTNQPAQQASTAMEQTGDGGRVRVRMTGDLVFEPGSARISRPGRRVLKEVAKVLKETAAKRIEVAGHTDSAPTNKKYEDNWQLSGERAHRVVAYLAAEGVDRSHLIAVGYGDTSPLDTADTAEARSKNRRVEIFITPQ